MVDYSDTGSWLDDMENSEIFKTKKRQITLSQGYYIKSNNNISFVQKD